MWAVFWQWLSVGANSQALQALFGGLQTLILAVAAYQLFLTSKQIRASTLRSPVGGRFTTNDYSD